MKVFITAIWGLAFGSCLCFSQNTFTVIGTPIPSALAKQNFGNVPKSVVTYELTVCNTSAMKQQVVSGEIYQALSDANGSLQPIGREVMLATILQNQNHSLSTIFSIALNIALTGLSAWNSSVHRLPSGLITATAFASVAGPPIWANWKQSLPANQLEQFETQTLEPALVLDAGSCAERTVFAVNGGPKSAVKSLSFHVR